MQWLQTICSSNLYFVFVISAGVGVYISRVEEGSVAERAGLRPGDSILQVNGTPFSGISHEDALKVNHIVFMITIFIKHFHIYYRISHCMCLGGTIVDPAGHSLSPSVVVSCSRYLLQDKI